MKVASRMTSMVAEEEQNGRAHLFGAEAAKQNEQVCWLAAAVVTGGSMLHTPIGLQYS